MGSAKTTAATRQPIGPRTNGIAKQTSESKPQTIAVIRTLAYLPRASVTFEFANAISMSKTPKKVAAELLGRKRMVENVNAVERRDGTSSIPPRCAPAASPGPPRFSGRGTLRTELKVFLGEVPYARYERNRGRKPGRADPAR
jgi:hypothetical protein